VRRHSRTASGDGPRATLGDVGSSEVATERAGGRVAPSAAQARIIAAALDLFPRHGVGGTSLQMIADHIGVTKAAVYHQYNTKDEIILAAAETELARVEAVVAAAETERSRTRARDVLLTGMIDLAVESRRTMSTILTDPVIGGFFADHETFRDVMHRLRRILLGDDHGPEARVRVAMLIAATSGAVMHPFVADLDDDTLRAELLRLARRFLGLRA
jgi:AcrR family transcriptional regulator